MRIHRPRGAVQVRGGLQWRTPHDLIVLKLPQDVKEWSHREPYLHELKVMLLPRDEDKALSPGRESMNGD